MDKTTNQELKAVRLFSSAFCPPDTDYLNRSPIILVHGAGGTNSSWRSIKQDLGIRTKRKVIAVDLRNHGKSEWPDEFSLDLGVADFEHFMAQQNLSKAIWMGHSYGGRVVLALAFKRPDLVEKMILEDMFMEMGSSAMGAMDKLLLLTEVIKKLPRSLSEEEAQSLVGKQLQHMFPDEVNNFNKNTTLVIPFYKDKTGEFKAYVDLDVKSKLGNLDFDLKSNPTYEGKTLVLTAEKVNVLQTKDTKQLRKHLPNYQEVAIIGGTHALHIENPPQVLEVVSKFINDE